MKRKICSILSLMLLLCSCSQVHSNIVDSTEISEKASSEEANNSPEAASETEQVKSSYGNWEIAHNNDLFCSDIGVYEVKSIFPDSVSLMFLDYASNIETFLCPNPNCPHNDESCPAYYPYQDYYPPTLIVVNDTIYLIDYGQEGSEPPRIVKRDNATGSISPLYQFGSTQSIGGKIYTDGSHLAFCLTTTEEQGRSYDIVSLDLEAGSLEILYHFDTDDYVQLATAYDENLVILQISSVSPETCTYLSFNPNYDTTPKEMYRQDFSVESVIFSDRYKYSMKLQSNIICREDLSTGEKVQLEIPLTDSQYLDFMQETIDGYLYISRVTDNSDATKSAEQLFCDFETCDCSVVNLNNAYNNSPVTIVSKYGNTLYVINNFTTKESYITTPEGPQYITSVFNQYAAISLEDFKASIPNYQEVKLLY